jgi:hypothetical protein
MSRSPGSRSVQMRHRVRDATDVAVPANSRFLQTGVAEGAVDEWDARFSSPGFKRVDQIADHQGIIGLRSVPCSSAW